jgi:ribosomal protein S1
MSSPFNRVIRPISQVSDIAESKGEFMAQHALWRLAMLTVWLIATVPVVHAASEVAGTDPQSFPGNRVVLGTVEEIRSDQAKINIGEVEPRYLPMNVRKDKGLPELKKGDLVEITINDQNLLVDVHKAGESSHHRVVRGQLAEAMPTGSDKAVIRTTDGKEESHPIRPVAKSKVASMPVGADVIFLIDELDKIVDVTMGSVESVHRAAELGQQKSPLKGNLSQVVGEILTPLKGDTIAIRTEDGKEHSYEVRPLIHPRLATLSKGDAAVLLVDEENKVADVAFMPAGTK